MHCVNYDAVVENYGKYFWSLFAVEQQNIDLTITMRGVWIQLVEKLLGRVGQSAYITQ